MKAINKPNPPSQRIVIDGQLHWGDYRKGLPGRFPSAKAYLKHFGGRPERQPSGARSRPMSENVFMEIDDGLSFIGDFDALYREERDPWEQSGCNGDAAARYYQVSRKRLVDALARHKAQGPGIEIGCGHGYLTAMLQGGLRTPVFGLDVSGEAVLEARRINPHVCFAVHDITKVPLGAPRGFVVWGQCLWYLLHEIDRAIDNTLTGIAPNGLFVLSQAFLREQRYGRHIADGFDGTLKLFLEDRRLRLIEAFYDDTDAFQWRDGLLIFRKMI